MTDRIDRYLDGDDEALAPAERQDAEVLRQAIDETAAFVRARPAPDLAAGIMHAIEQDDLRPASPLSSAGRRIAAALWTPRELSFHLRPVYGLATAAIVALAIVTALPLREPPQAAAPPASAAQLFVQFRFEAPGASDVRIAGSFTGWEPRHQLHEAAPGIWTITLPLPHGVHDYAFIVNGTQWVADPYAQQVNDGFGGTNSRIALLPPDPPQT